MRKPTKTKLQLKCESQRRHRHELKRLARQKFVKLRDLPAKIERRRKKKAEARR